MIHVEQVYFEEDELIRASSLDGDYENFMIMSIESPTRYSDFITVEGVYVGDTEHCDDKILTENDLADGAMKHSIPFDFEEELVGKARDELIKEVDQDGTAYIYICRREDDDFAIGVCTSTEPLKKATTEEWENL